MNPKFPEKSDMAMQEIEPPLGNLLFAFAFQTKVFQDKFMPELSADAPGVLKVLRPEEIN